MTRRSSLLVLVVGVALVAAWFFLLWAPKGEALDDARAREATAVDQAAQLEVRLAELRDAEARQPELLAAGQRLLAAVPAGADLATFLFEANRAATDAGVDFVSIAPSPPVASTTGGPTQVPLAIEVGGGYQRVLDYLDRLLALPRLVMVDTVSVTAADEGSDLQVSLTGRMFTTAAPPSPDGATTATTAVPATTPPPTVATETMEAG